MKNYLLEIGTEELPSSAVDIAREFFKEETEKLFDKFFQYKTPENIEIFASPRRIGFLVKNLNTKLPDEEKVITGPPAKISIDENGNYTKPAIAFAQKNNIPLEQLQVIKNEKGEYIGAKVKIEGKSLKQFIQEEIPQLIQRIPFKKTMKWNETGFRFARPIRWGLYPYLMRRLYHLQ